MSDMRLWSRETITQLIELYKTHPCLWKVSCKTYNNKRSKALAYKELVEFCKQRGFPEANRDFVFRKIQSLRGSFRKELRKAREYQSIGTDYQSSLWYFNNLMFTKDQDCSTSLTRKHESESEEDAQISSNEEDNESLADTKFDVNLVSKVENSACPIESPSPPSSPLLKRKKKNEHPQLEFYDIGQETKKELSEFDITGMSIAKKLARMDETQAIYAESLINSVIRKGLLNKLTEDTDLCDNLCGRRVLTVQQLPQPSS